MIETKDLIIRKARFEDWQDIYRNVWSHPECARYMFWRVTTSEEDARARMLRTLKWEAEHDSYFIFEKAGGQAIGFTGVEPVFEPAGKEPGGQRPQGPTQPDCRAGREPGGRKTTLWEEAGICIGPEFQRRGYGKQTAIAIMDYAHAKYGATEFQCSAREANIASRNMAESLGFTFHHSEQRIDDRDGSSYTMMIYRRPLP